jgi:hypothetical protein
MKKLILGLLFASIASVAQAQSTFTAKDAAGATQTFKSFNCTANICALSVPADNTGAAFGVTGNPFFVTNNGTFGVQLTGATNNINNIAGTVSLPTGASTAANQTSQITQETAINTVLGTQADAAWVSGSGTAIAILKNIANGIVGAIAAGVNYIGQIGLWQPLSAYVSGTTAAMTGTTSTQLLAAVTSKSLYVTSISCVNSHATVGTFVTIQDGSGGTALATLAAAAVYGGDEKNAGGGPLFKTTSGNGLFVANVTTGANVICNASGFSQ